MTLLTALSLLSSALKENPFSGIERSPLSMVLCSDLMKGLGLLVWGSELSPPLVLCDSL